MSELEELKMETVSRYDDYLYETEHRGVSYGEIAHIQGLNRQELEDFCEELENEIEKGENNVGTE